MSLGRVGRLMVGPPVPLPSPEDLVPMIPNLVSSPRVFGKRALVLIIQIFLTWRSWQSALFDLEELVECYLALVECSMPLTESQQVLKTRIGAPNRCSPRLTYQISPRIDSGVKFCNCSKCRLLFLFFLTRESMISLYTV
jgi:hypothetical protein